MAAGPELTNFKTNVDQTKSNLEQVKSSLQQVFDFVDDTKDLIGYVKATGKVSNKVYELSEYAVSIISLLEKMGPLGTTARIIREVLDGGPTNRDPNVLEISDSIRQVIWDINGDEDKNGNGRIDPISVNPDGEEGTRLNDLQNALNLVKADILVKIAAVDTKINYLDGVSESTSGFITALDVATESGANWAANFANLNTSIENRVAPANTAMTAVNNAYATVAGSISSLLSIFNLAEIDLSIDVNLDFGSLENFMEILEEPLRIAASAIEPIEAYLDAVGAALDLIITPVVEFLTESLNLDVFLDEIKDKIDAILPDFSPLENFELQVDNLIAELNSFATNAFAEVDDLLGKVDDAVEKLGDTLATTPVWGDLVLGPIGVGTSLNDAVLGGSDDEIIDAKGGNDTIDAGGGNDVIIATEGIDSIDGGTGTDMLYIDAPFSEFELFRDTQTGPIKIIHVRPGQNGVDFGSETIENVEILAFSNIVFENIQNAIIGGSVLNGDINTNKDDLLILNTTGTKVSGYHQANGLTGNDSLFGTNEADWLLGGTGNDVLVGQGGDDLLDGGTGSDTFLMLDDPNDTEQVEIYLDDGNGSSNSLTNVPTSEGDDVLLNIENAINEDHGKRYIFGGSGDNTIKSVDAIDILSGGGGNDVIEGGGAADFLIGGDGSDRVFGGEGNDFILAGGAAAAGHSDVYDGGAGVNTLSFQTGESDILVELDPLLKSEVQAPIRNPLSGLTTNAAVIIDAVAGTVQHVAGDGSIIATDIVRNFKKYIGSDFDDVIYGFDVKGGGNEGIIGGDGNDHLYIRNSNFAEGGDGDDTFFVTPGGTGGEMVGDAGNDTVDISGMGEVRVALGPKAGGSSKLSLQIFSATNEADFRTTLPSSQPALFDGSVESIENLTFGEYDDFVDLDGTIAPLNLNLNTGGGNDVVLHVKSTLVLDTGAGNDRIETSDPSTINAGADDDYIYSSGTNSTDSIDAGSGNDTIIFRKYGGSSATLTGGLGFDTLAFHDFDNNARVRVDLTLETALALFDQGGNSSFNRVETTATSIERVVGTAGNDELLGSAFGDQLIGQAGADLIEGKGGNDILYGGDSNDTLLGGDGQDFLHGGLGNDVINGGTNSGSGVESDTVSYATAYRDVRSGLDSLSPSSLESDFFGELIADVFGGVSVDLAAGTSSGAFGNDTISNIENVHGSNNDDELRGDANANYIAGGFGNDFMDGRGGDDFFALDGNDWAEGGDGEDTFFVAGGGDFSINGGANHDVLDFSTQTGSLTIDLTQGKITGTIDVDTPVWDDLGSTESRTVDGVTLTPLEVLEADPFYSNDASDASRTVPDAEDFDIKMAQVAQSFDSSVIGIEEVRGSAGDDTIIGQDGMGILGGGNLDTLLLNAGSETNQYVEIANFSDLPTSRMTVEMLYRAAEPYDIDGSLAMQFLSYAVSGSGGDNEVTLYESGGNFAIWFNNTQRVFTDVPVSSVIDGEPHRISFTFDSVADIMNLYIDGVVVYTSTSVAFSSVTAGGTLIIGQEQDGVGSSFNPNQILKGEVADIRVWDDVRTTQEIADNAFQEISNPTVDPNLVANWRPDATNGTVPDAAGGTALTLKSYGGSPLPDFSSLDANTDNIISGQDGNDTVIGGNGVDNLSGDEGDDTIQGKSGDDMLDGGEGTDTAVFSGNFEDYTYSAISNGFTFSGADGTDTVLNFENFEFDDIALDINTMSANRIDGTSGSDNLQGTSTADLILGFDGDDIINASNDGDTLLGGAGDDDLVGGAGADVLSGGTNTAVGDTATYSNSNARVQIDLGAGTATGGHATGDALIDIENLFGSLFGDTLSGDGGNNTINGFKGNDTIDGGLGDDTLAGGLGNDTFISSAGADVFNGGTGNDTADYSGSDASVTAQINNGGTVNGGHATGDTLIVENIIGSAFADDIIGNTVANVLNGNDGDDTFNASSGNDTVNGGGGDDFLLGSRGADVIDGGSNTALGDTASYSNSDARVVVDLIAGTATGSGHGSGDTLIDIENIFGSLFNDDIFGDNNDNVLQGFNGIDELFGRSGNDTLIGGGGFDFLNGGEGDDMLSGAGGDDRFLFDIANFGADTITDFTNNRDLMDFRGSGLQFSDLTVTVGATDTVITVTADPTNSITLQGITTLINEDDFIF